MPGVRIRPLPDRPVPDDSMIVLIDKHRPYPKVNKYGERRTTVCSICKIQHLFKAYHLQLRAGSVIISETIWAKFQTMPDNGGFEYMNHVEYPPTQTLTPGSETRLIEKYPIIEIAPAVERNRLAALIRPRSKSARAGEGAE